MKVRKINFMTPLEDEKTYKLDKKYSQTVVFDDYSEINISSNVGPRENQEDTVAVQINGNYILLLVADGVGGHEEGSKASYITAKTIQRWFNSLSQRKLMTMDEYKLRLMLIQVINEMKNMGFPLKGGTTLNMSIICPEKTYIFNIGDSRAYSIKNNEVIYRTIDDSLAFDEYYPTTVEQRDALRFYAKNNVITNCIEIDSSTLIRSKTIHNEDYSILCHMTDGVSDILDEATIRSCCMECSAAEKLVERAVTSGQVTNYKIDVPGFINTIYPHDNASAIVYTKRTRRITK